MKKKVSQNDSNEKRTSSLKLGISQERKAQIHNELTAKYNSLSIDAEVTDKEALVYYTVGRILSADNSEREDEELYQKAVECYNVARDLCDALAFKIFI
jgi:hypothetical protein